MGQKTVIVDSNVLVGLFLPDDALHKKATVLMKSLHDNDYLFAAINLVIQESATVISMRKGMQDARLFYQSLDKVIHRVVPLDDSLEKASWEVFLKQTRKGTSFVDCANLAAMEHYQISKIASFDRFYAKELLLGVVQ